MTVIDDIKARIDIVELVSETVKLRRSGRSYTGFCPFHPNTHTPAFAVFPESGTWRCFGQCNEGGDVFKFVMKKEGCDFPQALEQLAQKAGVTLEPHTPEREAEDEHVQRLRGLLEDAVTFYRHYLIQAPAGQEAMAYLKKRGLRPPRLKRLAWDTRPMPGKRLFNILHLKGLPRRNYWKPVWPASGRKAAVFTTASATGLCFRFGMAPERWPVLAPVF